MYTDRDLVTQRLRRDGYNETAIQFRLSRQPIAWADYLKYSQEYDEKIINTSDRKDFELLIEALFRKYTQRSPTKLVISSDEQFTLSAPLVGFKNQIEQRLKKYPYHKNIFLMMKFRGERNKRVYESL